MTSSSSARRPLPEPGGRLRPLRIGHVVVERPVLLAPMTGISDLPFRRLAQGFGAGLVYSEMIAGRELLRATAQSERMARFAGTDRPHAVQLAGRDPQVMADAARLNADRGVDIIDINFGCPAKKVVGGLGGAALMRDEALAGRILDAVVGAVTVPVTLKMRLGWDDQSRNAPRMARIAEDCGVQAIAVHGRTRGQFYDGRADWRAVAAVRHATRLPLIVNGDIGDDDSAEHALAQSGADAVMIGRAARGRPWLPGWLGARLTGNSPPPWPDALGMVGVIGAHLEAMLRFYGTAQGLRIARKHIGWYAELLPALHPLVAAFYRLPDGSSLTGWLAQLERLALEPSA